MLQRKKMTKRNMWRSMSEKKKKKKKKSWQKKKRYGVTCENEEEMKEQEEDVRENDRLNVKESMMRKGRPVAALKVKMGIVVRKQACAC